MLQKCSGMLQSVPQEGSGDTWVRSEGCSKGAEVAWPLKGLPGGSSSPEPPGTGAFAVHPWVWDGGAERDWAAGRGQEALGPCWDAWREGREAPSPDGDPR